MSGQPTSLDYMNGYNYAYQQINKLKCEDLDIISAVCNSKNSPGTPGGGTCIGWKEDKKEMTFPVPANYYVNQCSKDSDCDMGVCRDGYCSCVVNKDCKQGMECVQNPNSLDKLICGYAPKDVSAGHCVFTNKTACLAQGQLPYDCTPNGCVNKPQADIKYPYTEWRVDPDSGGGKCVLGNFLLRQWCEQPVSRCVKDPDTGTFPSECTSGSDTPGVTDVPPFYYDGVQGMCYMTHDYCDHYGKDYNKPKCSKDADCPGKNNYCVQDPSGLSMHCVGPDSQCDVSSGDEAGQFFLGRTLFYMFKKGTFCKESYEPPKPDWKDLEKTIAEKFNNTAMYACLLYDSKKIDKKKLMMKEFAGKGIHLYMTSWKSGKTELCFDPAEVEKVYPSMVENHLQGKLICIHRDEIKTDKNLKRMYLMINSRGWATGLIANLIKKVSPNK